MFSPMKRLHIDKKDVFAYWQRSADKMTKDSQFGRLKDTMIFDHTWFTTVSAFIDEGKIKDGDRILDAGCGWGRIISGIKFFKPGSALVGVDANLVRLAAAKKTLADMGLDEKVTLEVGDVDNLGFADCTFDVVVCARLLQYVPNPESTIRELCRVLRPGGRLVLTIPNKLNPVRVLTYTRKLYSEPSVRKWLLANNLEDISSRTIGFLPGVKRFHWTSKWLLMEKAQRMPVICHLGGLVLASGKKPNRFELHSRSAVRQSCANGELPR
jgi:ubiquinone/menaquinone biosynthesis C-methylase UbiE